MRVGCGGGGTGRGKRRRSGGTDIGEGRRSIVGKEEGEEVGGTSPCLIFKLSN